VVPGGIGGRLCKSPQAGEFHILMGPWRDAEGG